MQQLLIAGNIGKNAEVRRLQNGDPVCNFSVAVDNGKDKQGQRRDSTWYDCSLWGKRGEALEQYLTKGGKVTVTGRPTVRVHEGKAYLGINVDQITLQGGGNSSGERDQGGGGGYGAGGGPNSGGMADDEIPFAPSWK